MSDWKSRAIPVPESHDPSWKDRAQEVPAPGEEPTTSDDALLGGAQGLALGFADELEGGAKAAYHKLTDSDSEKEKIADLYRKYQQLAQTKYKEAEERSPYAYKAGGLVGAALPIIATAGLGAAPEAAALGARGAMAGKALLGGAEAVEALPALSTGAKALSAAKQGAALGAVQGAGSSEATLDQSPEQLAKDAASSAAIGGVLGGGISAVGSGLSAAGKGISNKIAEAAEDNPFLRKVGKAFDLGKEGKNLSSEKVQLDLARAPSDTAKGMVDKIQKIDSHLGEQVGAAIDDATDQGVRFDFSPHVKEAFSDLEQHFERNPTISYDRDAAKTFQYLKRQMQPKVGAAEQAVLDPASEVSRTVTPVEAKQMVSELHEMSDKLSGATDQNSVFLKNTIKKVIGGVDGDLEQNVPGYLNAKKRFIDFRQNVPETIIAKQKPQEVVGKWYGDRSNKTNDLYSSLNDTLSNSGYETQGANNAKVARDNMMKGLKTFSENEEGRVGAGGIEQSALPKEDVAGIAGTTRDIADQTALLGQAQGYSGHEGLGSTVQKGVTGLSTVGKGAVAGIANKTGVFAQSAPVKLAQNLYAAPKQILSQHAQTLKNTPGMGFLGKALEEGLTNGDQAKQNAAVFAILQNPSARKLLQPDSTPSE